MFLMRCVRAVVPVYVRVGIYTVCLTSIKVYYRRSTFNVLRTRWYNNTVFFFCFVFPSRKYLVRDYESQQSRTVGTEAVSRMLSTHLYYRRSFPFYTFNIVGGLDAEGAFCRASLRTRAT